MLAPWKKNYDKTRYCIKKEKHYFADKGPYSQNYDFSSNCVSYIELTLYYLLKLELLLLLLSRFSHVWLCATPQTATHQAPPSLGFSRQEHWSGSPFPSPMQESEKWKWSRSVVPTRLLRPWDFPGKSAGVGCHCLLRPVANSRLFITFLPRSKHLLISWLQSPSAVILDPPAN